MQMMYIHVYICMCIYEYIYNVHGCIYLCKYKSTTIIHTRLRFTLEDKRVGRERLGYQSREKPVF